MRAETSVPRGRQMMLDYIAGEVADIEQDWFEGVDSLREWEKRRKIYRRQIAEMLGLYPQPPKTDLQPAVTRVIDDHPDFTVEVLHFQSLPGLYVTANFYLPRNRDGEVPVVLYLCGHAREIEDGVSYGNKVPYQHNPAWYARHGIASLVIDTIDHGEILGMHHGTYRFGRWWWQNRGYSPGAIETWNAIRALDYLETRPEIDTSRIGATGRSGGGMYSWYLLALDDRVTASVPVAGLTDLRNHLIDGVISGHCDCNYWNNYHRLDTTVLAALAAPRPVKLVNTDDDAIFPTSGIRRIEEEVAAVYALYNKEDSWAVYIGEGPHRDTRELQIETYTWFHRWLKDEPIDDIGEVDSYFDREQLRVFQDLPKDEINTRIDEVFIPAPTAPEPPQTARSWSRMKSEWMRALEQQTFAGWPESPDTAPAIEPLDRAEVTGGVFTASRFVPEDGIDLRLWTFAPESAGTGAGARDIVLRVLDADSWLDFVAALRSAAPGKAEALIGPGAQAAAWPDADAAAFARLREAAADGTVIVFFAPRGIGPTWYENGPENRGDVVTRGFPMLGQTIDGMRVWDVRQAVRALRATANGPEEIALEAKGTIGVVALYASLFDEPADVLRLAGLPADHHNGPYLLNIDRILGLPQTFAMAADRTEILLKGDPAVRKWADSISLTAAPASRATLHRLRR